MKKKNQPNGTALNERAMLVNLSIGFWEGRKKDKQVSDEVADENRATKDAGNWWTNVVPPSAIRPILSCRTRARRVHQTFSLPWYDDGFRMLPATTFLDYTNAMRKAKAEYEAEVEKFLGHYPKLVKEAQGRLGDLFKADQYPSVGDLRERFPWTLRFVPLPSAQDFRVDLGEEATKDIRRSIEQQSDAAMKTAMGDLWQRLYDGVSKIAERLADPEGVFRDSLLGNMTELCDLLPKMNVTGSAELEAMRQEVVAKLTKQEPEVLRKNKTARASAASTANGILKRMSEYMK